MGLLPHDDWLHFAVGIAGTVIMVYAFVQRFLKEKLLCSEVMMATAIGILVGPPVLNLVRPDRFGSTDSKRFGVLEEVRAWSHLPHSLRNLLQAESGANDGTALPLVMLPILLLKDYSTGEALGKWFYEVWFYQVALAILVGFVYGTLAWGLKYVGTRWNLIDEPSYLAHVIGLALGSVGLLRSIGSGEVLSVFCSSIAFSSSEPTAEESKYDAINGIELIVTITYFMYFGAILPTAAWQEIGILRLLLFSVGVIFLRRLPVLIWCAPWVGPLRQQPGGAVAMYTQLIEDELTWNVISFVVLASVLIYGLSAAPLSKLVYITLKKARRAANEKARLNGSFISSVPGGAGGASESLAAVGLALGLGFDGRELNYTVSNGEVKVTVDSTMAADAQSPNGKRASVEPCAAPAPAPTPAAAAAAAAGAAAATAAAGRAGGGEVGAGAARGGGEGGGWEAGGAEESSRPGNGVNGGDSWQAKSTAGGEFALDEKDKEGAQVLGKREEGEVEGEQEEAREETVRGGAGLSLRDSSSTSFSRWSSNGTEAASVQRLSSSGDQSDADAEERAARA
eukprot:jgi/Mesen1/10050/ME000073S09328